MDGAARAAAAIGAKQHSAARKLRNTQSHTPKNRARGPNSFSSRPSVRHRRGGTGISCGSFVDHAGLLQRYLELGANIFWTGTELSLLDGAYHSLCQRFRQTVLEGK